jgi:hypothetical protein
VAGLQDAARALDADANDILRRNLAGTGVILGDVHTQRVGLVDDDGEVPGRQRLRGARGEGQP